MPLSAIESLESEGSDSVPIIDMVPFGVPLLSVGGNVPEAIKPLTLRDAPKESER